MEHATFPEFLYKHIAINDDRKAIIDFRTQCSFSYGELKQKVGAVGSALTKRGFRVGNFLTLFTTNCIENVAIAHGTMATGGTLHLVKPFASKSELKSHIEMVQPRFLVCTSDLMETVKAVIDELQGASSVEETFTIGSSADQLLNDDGEKNPLGKVCVDAKIDVAALLLTGGTTRMSKSVMATHASLKLSVEINFEFISERCMFLTYQPFSYVSSFIITYGTLIRKRATVITVPTFCSDEILLAIEKCQVSDIILFPAALNLMIQSPNFENADLSSLRHVLTGGAPISIQSELRFTTNVAEKSKDAVFIQAYGMTEALSLLTNAFPCHRSLPNKKGTVGVPIENVEIKIVSVENECIECKPNEKGQILVRAPTFMKGYFKNEQLTRQVLKNCWYYTGDYGWLDSDNYLFVIDRIEELIHIKDGRVIAPSQLEEIIRSHDKVEECVVIGKPILDDCLPTAFVVSKGQVSSKEIEEFVSSKVEEHQRIRGGVIFVNEIPKSSSGKLLRRKLMSYIQM